MKATNETSDALRECAKILRDDRYDDSIPGDLVYAADFIDSLRARVAELEQDKARLDWLEHNVYVGDSGTPFDGTNEWRKTVDYEMEREDEPR